jgi:hypothetical protein
MSTVEAIEAAIGKLSRDELFRLLSWVRTKFRDEWDSQIEEDVKAGRLDRFAAEARAEYRAGQTKPFPSDEK